MLPASCNLLVILGATATGKTRVGVELARCLDGEIISADSRQVFRGMDLGTGKDLAEYAGVPYHLIDILESGSEFSLFDFASRFCAAFSAIRGRGRLPLLVGGTGLYLDAVLSRYQLRAAPENPELRAELAPLDDDQLRARLLQLKPGQHNRSDLEERPRLLRAIEIAAAEASGSAELLAWPELSPLCFGLQWPREELRRRIGRRLQERLAQGMIAEVAALQAAGVSWEMLDYYGLEYRFIAAHLRGEGNRNDMTQRLASAIGQFAKRQETWFRRMEKQGVAIRWVDGAGDPTAAILAQLAELKR